MNLASEWHITHTHTSVSQQRGRTTTSPSASTPTPSRGFIIGGAGPQVGRAELSVVPEAGGEEEDEMEISPEEPGAGVDPAKQAAESPGPGSPKAKMVREELAWDVPLSVALPIRVQAQASLDRGSPE